MVVALRCTLICLCVVLIDAQDYAQQLANWAQLSTFQQRNGIEDNAMAASQDNAVAASVLTPEASNQYRRRRNRVRKRLRNKKQPQVSAFDDDYYFDRDDSYKARDSGYQAPSSGYSSPTSGYDAPSSYEAPSYEAPSYQAEASDSYGAPSSGGGGFGDFLSALTAFLPIGLFLAAIPPNLITVSTRRKRSELGENDISDYTYPFLEKISRLGMDKLRLDVECQKELFCEMAVYGENQEANAVQKGFNYVVKKVPNFMTSKVGLSEVFEAAKNNTCKQSFKCDELYE